MKKAIIRLEGLTKKYGDYTAVNHLNLTIQQGEVFGLLGPNGAGKSTTILMLLGLTEPTSGFVEVCGINSTNNPVAAKKKIGYLPEDVGFYEDRTGLENLLFTAQLNQIPLKQAREKAEQLLIRVGLAGEAEKKVGKYSRGMRQRLGLADVLVKDPEVIILDEPTLGIDPKGVRELVDLIGRLSKEDGLTVLLSSHHLHQVQQVCDRVGLFVNGKLIAEGDIKSLSQQLFSNEPFVIETRVSLPDKTKKTRDQLQKSLKGLKGVGNVRIDNDSFLVGCTADISGEVAKTVIASGAELYSLNKKEYGLDDIYQRYFEENGNK